MSFHVIQLSALVYGCLIVMVFDANFSKIVQGIFVNYYKIFTIHSNRISFLTTAQYRRFDNQTHGMVVEGSFTRNDVFQMAIRVAFVSAVTYFSIKWLVNQIDPTSKSRKKAEERAREQLRKYVLIFDSDAI